MLSIVGGVYREYCMHPDWLEIYGSGGRAASAISQMARDVELHTYIDAVGLEVLEMRAAMEGFSIRPRVISNGASFSYAHGLSTPTIRKFALDAEPIRVRGDRIICYGMLEGNGIIEGDYVVYDPQNSRSPVPLHANGSSAEHLALILNSAEASAMSGLPFASPEEKARILAVSCGAEVVVIKLGAQGALVYYGGESTYVPAYHTRRVWKIGSGDTFVAHFGYHWMSCNASPVEAATFASKATAYYCETRGFPNREQLQSYNPTPLHPTGHFKEGTKPLAYLAGPFFTLGQRWLIDEARAGLHAMGLSVFSPLHDVGRGTAEDVVHLDLDGLRKSDVVFAIGDGLDAGTIYEIGYARALGKPVILYSENESEQDKKMMQGSGCVICDDFTTAVYQTAWKAITE